MKRNDETPTRLEVLDLEGRTLGYKIDSCWSLSRDPNRYKPHQFKDTGPEGQLANNLLYIFNYLVNSEVSENCWMKKHQKGIIVSVQDVSGKSFGKELLRYRIVKEEDKYICKE